MSRILRVILIPVIVAAVPVFSSASQPPEGSGADSAKRLADEYLEAYLERYPEVATDFGIPGRTHDRLTDISREAISAWQGREDAWLARLGSLGGEAPVGSPDWAIAGLVRETLEGSIAFRVCRDELWSVSQTGGWQTYLPHILKVQPLGSDELRRQAVARVRALVGFLEADVANLKEGLSLGYSSPRRNVELTLEQLRRLNVANSPLASPLERDEDPNFQTSYSQALDDEVYPALGRYIAFLEDEYVAAARDEIPVAANPHGMECYRAAVRHHSTLDMPAPKIHELGLQQMAGILEEMRVIGARSFGTKDVPSLLNRVTTEQEFTFSTREEIIAFSEAAYARARDAMPRFFGRVPKAEVVIEPYPAFLEATGTGEYWPPAEDGSRPGTYYIPVTDPGQRPIAIYESLAFHETVPGHHLQLAIALELGDDAHPLARYLYNSGYGEGWGLYAERLADEMGLYSSDLARVGMLGDQAARAARLVVDTGIHTMGWSRQRAIDYMNANTTWTEPDIEAEVDRYIVMPGQATAYMLGMLRIFELRAKATDALGDAFDIRVFHDLLLENGAVSLAMLDARVDAWIVARRAETDQ